MVTRLSVAPGHVDALEQADGGEQAARSSSANAFSSAGLGRSAWVRSGRAAAAARAVGRRVHGPPAGEQRQRAAAGGVDERRQLVVAGRLEGRRRGSGRWAAQ